MKEELNRTINVLQTLTNKVINIKQKSKQCLSIEQYQQLSARLVQMENSIVPLEDFDFSIFKKNTEYFGKETFYLTESAFAKYKNYELYIILQSQNQQQIYCGKLIEIWHDTTPIEQVSYGEFNWQYTNWFINTDQLYNGFQLFNIKQNQDGTRTALSKIYRMRSIELINDIANLSLTGANIKFKIVQPNHSKIYVSTAVNVTTSHSSGAA